MTNLFNLAPENAGLHLKKPTILVIGAGGQLGSELTQGLRDHYSNATVIATDIREPAGYSGIFELLDATDRAALHKLLGKYKVTQLYHLAAMLSAKGEQRPEEAWRLNMDSLMHVLDAAVEFRLERVYWPSSIAVFGPMTPKDNTPQHTITDPTTVYGISKVSGERWCAWYHARHGVDVRSLRFPGLIGYKSRPGGGTTDYAVDIYFSAVKDGRYTCFLKEDTRLPMMYMDDAIRATIQLMEADPKRLTIRSSYNIAGMNITPAEIADSIRRHMPEFEIRYEPDYRQAIADSWPRSIDDSAARNDWGWQPSYGLEEMTVDMLQRVR